MAGSLAVALDRRIREIISVAHKAAATLGEAFRSETGSSHPLLGGVAVPRGPGRPPGVPNKTASTGGKKKRIRRSAVQLTQEALDIVELIKSKGKEGADGKEIREKFPKVGQSIKDFVAKHGKVKITSSGKGVAMRYALKD